MDARHVQSAAGLLLVATSVAAGLAWRECMLPAIGGVLAYRLVLLRMDSSDAPWTALTAALGAVSAGVLGAAVGLTLLVEVGLAWWGWWQPSAPHPWPMLLLLGMAAAGCCLAQSKTLGIMAELRAWLWLFAGVVLALMLHRTGWSVAPCAFVAIVGADMLWIGWQLAAVTGMALLREASDQP